MPPLIGLVPIVFLFFILCCKKITQLTQGFYSFLFNWLKGVLFGCVFVILHGNHYRYVTETLFAQGEQIVVQASVEDFVQTSEQGTTLLISINGINQPSISKALDAKSPKTSKIIPIFFRPKVHAFLGVIESNSGAQSSVSQQQFVPKLGECWQWQLRVKPVIGKRNDAGFDSERHYVSNQWHGKAVIQPQTAKQLNLTDCYSWRLWIHQKVAGYLNDLPAKPFILALTFGDRRGISSQQWKQLRNSGLAHLMAISGLHIGLALSFGWLIGRGLKSIISLVLSRIGKSSISRMNCIRFLPFICSFMLACSYAYLAGFSLPTQRALIMGSLVLLTFAARIHWSVWQLFLHSLLLILIVWPFSILQASFWLSFLAVAMIFFALWFYVRPEKLPTFVSKERKNAKEKGGSNYLAPVYPWLLRFKKILIIQLGLFIGLSFLNILIFGGISWLSPLFNLAAIPWVSIVTVPLIFMALACTLLLSVWGETPVWIDAIWKSVDLSLQPILWMLERSDGAWLPLSVDWVWLSVWLVIAITSWYFRFRFLGLAATIVISVLYFFPIKPLPIWQVKILDVGQGLAVLIQKDQQSILYDTGIAWEDGSIVRSIIEPVLNKQGQQQLSGMIISHSDSDHAGGRKDVEQDLTPKWIRSSELGKQDQPCIKGQQWTWNGLHFEALWPPKMVKRAYNPHSCVVRISDGRFSLLLTGDVDRISEILLSREAAKPVDVILVPHHGSDTSSSQTLLNAFQPKLAIASVSLDNQWSLPSQRVKQRYLKSGSEWLDTAHSGQITLSIWSDSWKVEQKRSNIKGSFYQNEAWYRQIVRNGLE
ncbi:MAG: DNA internalization-related competence protein ComEC/Rec2 [Vibrio sp.]